MSNNEYPSPVHELMALSYHYETKNVGSTRKEKICSLCSKMIPKGSSHKVETIYRDEHVQANICNDCEVTYKTELAQMRDRQLDDY